MREKVTGPSKRPFSRFLDLPTTLLPARTVRFECMVPVLTLGATRRFLIKPRNAGRSITFKPGSGDLIVMGGRSQQDWVHCVPKEPGMIEARISVNFQNSAQASRDNG